MINLNDAVLEEAGLGSLPPDEKASLLVALRSTLEERVGMRIARLLTNNALIEINALIISGQRPAA